MFWEKNESEIVNLSPAQATAKVLHWQIQSNQQNSILLISQEQKIELSKLWSKQLKEIIQVEETNQNQCKRSDQSYWNNRFNIMEKITF